jgi:hypothetical protein
VQRLQGLGRAAGDDWLARLSTGWAQGMGPNGSTQAHWNYTSVYADAGRYLRAGHNVLYVQARQGRSWGLADDWVISPHVLVAGRAEQPDAADISYAEWGLGVALRHVFGGTRYEAPGRSAELLLQYKRGSERVGSGWVLTFVLGL